MDENPDVDGADGLEAKGGAAGRTVLPVSEVAQAKQAPLPEISAPETPGKPTDGSPAPRAVQPPDPGKDTMKGASAPDVAVPAAASPSADAAEKPPSDRSRGAASAASASSPATDKPAPSSGPSSSRDHTPAQVLQAGRRAEAAGRPDYAVKFYRHLVDFHPGTEEGAVAKESLDRLSAAGRRPGRDLGRSSLFPELDMLAASLPVREARPSAGGETLAKLTPRQPALPPAGAESPGPGTVAATGSYRMGTVLAHLLSGFGVLFVAGGIVIPAAAITGRPLGPFTIDVAGIPFAVLFGVLAAGLGVNMLVSSLMARALFRRMRREG